MPFLVHLYGSFLFLINEEIENILVSRGTITDSIIDGLAYERLHPKHIGAKKFPLDHKLYHWSENWW